MKTNRDELIEGMKELTRNGYKCFMLKEDPLHTFGFVVTPKDNVIYIQPNNFHMGWETTLKYKPSTKNGNGCRCLTEPFINITTDNIIKSENEGLIFARKLGATLYKSSSEYIDNLWNKGNYEEVTA